MGLLMPEALYKANMQTAIGMPEDEIYRLLLTRYHLDPSQTLFIDDRRANLDAASRFGIATFLFDHRDPETSCTELERMLL